MALYKHVASLEALKHLVAEEIFHRWQLPSPPGPDGKELQQYLFHFADEVSIFCEKSPRFSALFDPQISRHRADACKNRRPSQRRGGNL